MSTFLVIAQVLCYGIGIVSAGLNIVRFARSWRAMSAPFDDPNW
jgi:hypothetical protein